MMVFLQTLLQIVNGLWMTVGHSRNMADGRQRQVIAIQLIQHRHIKWRGGGSLFIKSMHVEVMMIVTLIGQSVNQVGITMESENDRLIAGEQRIKLRLRFAMRMLLLGLQCQQVDHINHADA